MSDHHAFGVRPLSAEPSQLAGATAPRMALPDSPVVSAHSELPAETRPNSVPSPTTRPMPNDAVSSGPEKEWDDVVFGIAAECAAAYMSKARPFLATVVADGIIRCQEAADHLGVDRKRVPPARGLGRRIRTIARHSPLCSTAGHGGMFPGKPGWNPAKPLAQVRIDGRSLGHHEVIGPSGPIASLSLWCAFDLYSNLIVASGVYVGDPTGKDLMDLFCVPGGKSGGITVRTCDAHPDAILLAPAFARSSPAIGHAFAEAGIALVYASASDGLEHDRFEGLDEALTGWVSDILRIPKTVDILPAVIGNWLRVRDVTPVGHDGETPIARWRRGVAKFPIRGPWTGPPSTVGPGARR